MTAKIGKIAGFTKVLNIKKQLILQPFFLENIFIFNKKIIFLYFGFSQKNLILFLSNRLFFN